MGEFDFDIDADISRAFTLPSRFYTDPRLFELSKERIFKRTWQLVGRINKKDNLTPFTLLPGFLDEPILLSDGPSGPVCLSNVCTHRGKILVEGPCSGQLIRCGYHGRRFSLEGKFLSMPEFEGVEDFPGPNDDLVRYPMGERDRFVFASISPAADVDEFVEGWPAIPKELELTAAREYEVNAHWALYCENFLEGFHIPYVHKSLNALVDYGTYTTETFRYSSVQRGFDERGEAAGTYLFIFPNLMFNFYPWGISVNVVKPVAPDKTAVEFLTYVSDAAKLGKGAGADLHGVEMEDEAVVESVQKGIRSTAYDRGRYSPTREQGTHHFHRLIAEFMG